MKVKRIRIKSWEESKRDLLALARILDRGEIPKKVQKGDYFESLDAVRNVLTDKRLELWRAIRDEKPESLTALASLLKRDFAAVHRDALMLQSVGLISLRRTKGTRGDLRAPVSLADQLLVEVA